MDPWLAFLMLLAAIGLPICVSLLILQATCNPIVLRMRFIEGVMKGVSEAQRAKRRREGVGG